MSPARIPQHCLGQPVVLDLAHEAGVVERPRPWCLPKWPQKRVHDLRQATGEKAPGHNALAPDNRVMHALYGNGGMPLRGADGTAALFPAALSQHC